MSWVPIVLGYADDADARFARHLLGSTRHIQCAPGWNNVLAGAVTLILCDPPDG